MKNRKSNIVSKLLSITLSFGMVASIILPVAAEDEIIIEQNDAELIANTNDIVEETPVIDIINEVVSIEIKDDSIVSEVSEDVEEIVTVANSNNENVLIDNNENAVMFMMMNNNQQSIDVKFDIDVNKGTTQDITFFNGQANDKFNQVVQVVPNVNAINNYEFIGWMYNNTMYNSNVELINAIGDTELTSSINITAVFKENLKTTLKFVVPGQSTGVSFDVNGDLEYSCNVEVGNKVSLSSVLNGNSIPKITVNDPSGKLKYRGWRVEYYKPLMTTEELEVYLSNNMINAGDTKEIKVGFYSDDDYSGIKIIAGENGSFENTTEETLFSGMYIGKYEAQNVSTIMAKSGYPIPKGDANYEFDYWTAEDLAGKQIGTYSTNSLLVSEFGRNIVGYHGGYVLKANFKQVAFDVNITFDIDGNGLLNQQEKPILYNKNTNFGNEITVVEVLNSNAIPTPNAKNGNEFTGWRINNSSNLLNTSELEQWVNTTKAANNTSHTITAVFNQSAAVVPVPSNPPGNNSKIDYVEPVEAVVVPVVANPVVQTPEDEVIIPEEITPESLPTINDEIIIDEETPLVLKNTSWGLVDLILMILTICLGLICMLRKNNKIGSKVISLITLFTSVVLFFATQDLGGSMILVSNSTIAMAIIVFVQMIIIGLANLKEGQFKKQELVK